MDCEVKMMIKKRIHDTFAAETFPMRQGVGEEVEISKLIAYVVA